LRSLLRDALYDVDSGRKKTDEPTPEPARDRAAEGKSPGPGLVPNPPAPQGGRVLEDPVLSDYVLIPQFLELGTGLEQQVVALPDQLVEVARLESAYKVRDFPLLQSVFARVVRKAKELNIPCRLRPAMAIRATAIGFTPTPEEIQGVEHINTHVFRQLAGHVGDNYRGEDVSAASLSPSGPTVPTNLATTIFTATKQVAQEAVLRPFGINLFRGFSLQPGK